MRKITPHLLALALLLIAGCQSAPSAKTIVPTQCGDIRNLHQIGDLYVSGAVTPSDYPMLKDLGIKTVLNIRHAAETPGHNGAALATAQGITYVHLPWSGADQLTNETLDAMRQVLREAERPILFHCGSANRVGAGYLAYRVLDEGAQVDTALIEAKTFGLRTPAYEKITLDYIASQQSR